MSYFDAIGLWIREFFLRAWGWVSSLNYQEWFLLLAATTLCGFMCMRGFGSRANY
ncbi:MAG: hypothetical protein KF688_02665 [Pirellulales bacterium]|nr:hypothetical protein [Pirellulales bacterium]MBX3434861.1 hypothetical protein [Pirellulales bacterium]